jgi:hypothetical protein
MVCPPLGADRASIGHHGRVLLNRRRRAPPPLIAWAAGGPRGSCEMVCSARASGHGRLSGCPGTSTTAS